MATKEWYQSHKEEMRAYRKKWYNANREKQKSLVRTRRCLLAKWFAEIKATLKCEICGEDHPACLDFHHKGSDKTTTVSEAVCNRNWCKQRIIEEIAKCQVFCSNCHRKHHWSLDAKTE